MLVQGHWCQLQEYLSIWLDSGSAFPFPLVYLVFTCSMSVLLSWATMRSDSVWPATIGHGAINSTAALAGYLLKGLALGLLFNRRAFAQNTIVEQTFDQDKIAERNLSN